MTTAATARGLVRSAGQMPRLRLAAGRPLTAEAQRLVWRGGTGLRMTLAPRQVSCRPFSASSARNRTGETKRKTAGPSKTGFTVLASVGVVSMLLALSQPLLVHAEDEEDKEDDGDNSSSSDDRDPSLPRYRLADIRQHGAQSAEPWVTSGDKVYDITDWVSGHPGGEVILQAAGGSIDPYWKLFSIHQAPHVYEILAQYLIGLIDAADLVDGRPAAEQIEDPFAGDPARDDRLVVHTAKPCNAEPPRTAVATSFATPNALFYVRNHMWVPAVDAAAAEAHPLTVELPDGSVRVYTLAELRQRFAVHTVTAVMQCAGNRRSDMTAAVGPTRGLPWGVGAIGNAVWEGVRLRDVLADAGLGTDGKKENWHVQFSGLEAYGASIPLATALDPRGDVLLAFGMNGAPLPPDHGFPLRAVVPGHVAARSVKWLSRIVVADEESPSQWQRRDYKLFGPNEGSTARWDRYPAIQEMPVTSAITGVWVGAEGSGSGNAVAVTGYAYSGGGREIVRVDVSVDGGQTWDQAELVDHKGPLDETTGGLVAAGVRDWAWKRWRYAGRLDLDLNLNLNPGGAEIVVKATDSAYNTQPEHHHGIYNLRGNLATAWHRVRLCREGPQGCGFGSPESNESNESK